MLYSIALALSNLLKFTSISTGSSSLKSSSISIVLVPYIILVRDSSNTHKITSGFYYLLENVFLPNKDPLF